MSAAATSIKRKVLPAGAPVIGCLAGLVAITTPAGADLKICNQTLNLYNVAIGRDDGDMVQTEGWWTLPANTCVAPIEGPLSDKLGSPYVYVYAMDVHGKPALRALSGSVRLCVDRKKFQPGAQLGAKDCWLNGKLSARFSRIDTKGENDWTIFIRQGRTE